MPMRAPRRRGSAASSSKVSETARNNSAYSSRWFLSASGRSASGKVKTTCEYGTGRRLEACLWSQRSRAVDWHLGQWRLRHDK